MENNLTDKFRIWLLDNFKPGDRLPDEFELAELFSVARTTIRETISYFQKLGILTRNPRRGTFVSCPSKENISSTLQMQLQFYNYGFEEIKQARQFIETAMASQLVAKITPQDIDHLAALIDQMSAAENEPEKADRLDLEFHLAMATISGNRILEIFSCIMLLIFEQKYRVPFLNTNAIRKSVQDHRIMLDTILAGDADLLKQLIELHIKPLRSENDV